MTQAASDSAKLNLANSGVSKTKSPLRQKSFSFQNEYAKMRFVKNFAMLKNILKTT